MPTLDRIEKAVVENHRRELLYHLLCSDRGLPAGRPGRGNLSVQALRRHAGEILAIQRKL